WSRCGCWLRGGWEWAFVPRNQQLLPKLDNMGVCQFIGRDERGGGHTIPAGDAHEALAFFDRMRAARAAGRNHSSRAAWSFWVGRRGRLAGGLARDEEAFPRQQAVRISSPIGLGQLVRGNAMVLGNLVKIVSRTHDVST